MKNFVKLFLERVKHALVMMKQLYGLRTRHRVKFSPVPALLRIPEVEEAFQEKLLKAKASSISMSELESELENL